VPGGLVVLSGVVLLGGNLGFATARLTVAGVVATGGLGASPLLVVPATGHADGPAPRGSRAAGAWAYRY
jgi:MFS transporter, FSR family, fosmidomycin resistance protein